jgi:hypothetical protein
MDNNNYEQKLDEVFISTIVELKEQILDTINPTGGVFVKYNPSKIANMKLAPNIKTLADTSGKSKNTIVTIYRGAPKNQKNIVPGDFITTEYELAKSYAGSGHVISKRVKLGEILDDVDEPMGSEYIFKP